ncbi:MAG: hypothetical protein RIQ68_1294 [Pseudomonadota bacterium]|jgi:hypothetical protein
MPFDPLISERARLRANILFLAFEVKLIRLARLLTRVERKDDDAGGSDGDADDLSTPVKPQPYGSVELADPPYQLAQDFPNDHNGPPENVGEERPDLEDVPTDRPLGRGELSPILRMISNLAALLGLATLATRAPWIMEYGPQILSNNDLPKSLSELQKDVGVSKPGYEDHHIVEQTGAARDGFPRELIDSPQNLVKIPTLKHREITSWYGTRNTDFGGQTPREYLSQKSWDERYRIGIEQLIERGVLRP